MSTLLDRIRAALANDYLVDEEVARGGMAAVFHARDKRLERVVAIKVIKPELATARMVERFTREARLLANLNHPRIVPIYTAGEADGLFYYVMPFVPGETLESRLARGPMSPREARRVIGDVLEALAAAHRMDVVHRDVNARNVFIVNGRAMLGDFGLAASQHETTTAGGTIGSMSPEQSRGDAVGIASDVYAAGALLYRALTGRALQLTVGENKERWNDVPAATVPVLRKALAWDADLRFQNAEAFARALQGTRRTRVVAAASSVMILAGTVAAFYIKGDPADSADSDLAILPFDVLGTTNAAVGKDLATLVAMRLQGLPGMQLASPHFTFRWFDAHEQHDYRQLHARYFVNGTVVTQGAKTEVTVTVLDYATLPYATWKAVGDSAQLNELADTVALQLLNRLLPRFAHQLITTTPIASRDVDAQREFLQGEEYFRRGSWARALQHYSAALALDSSSVMAAWRLLNVMKWMPTFAPYPNVDLAGVYARNGSSVSGVERGLIEAQITPPGVRRLALLDSVVRLHPRDAYAALLYGDELFHRGALVGRTREEALVMLQQAANLNHYLAPAHQQIAWSATRLGQRAIAEKALEDFRAAAVSLDPADLATLPLLQQGFIARFDSARSPSALRAFFNGTAPEGVMVLRFGARAANSLALPHTQLIIGELLAHASAATSRDRSTGHEARGLAYLMLGQTAAGLAEIDSATALYGDAGFELERNEWRVVGSAFGWPDVPPREVTTAKQKLTKLTRNPLAANRARWALSLDTTSVPADDPFQRAVLRMKRAQRLMAMGKTDVAESELLWTQNADITGWPSGPAQAAEIDWVFALPALSMRAGIARTRGDMKSACARRSEALQLLRGAPMPPGLFKNLQCAS